MKTALIGGLWALYLLVVLPLATLAGWSFCAELLTEQSSVSNAMAVLGFAFLLLHGLAAIRYGLTPTYRFLRHLIPMKNALLVVSIALLAVACTKVEPGYVGIKVNQYGDQKGVEDFPLVTGRVTFNPFTTDIYKFPTFRQNVLWDEANGDESMTFNSVEGSVVNADVGLSYSIDPNRVPALFVAFRKDIESITDVYLRAEVRDSIARHAGSIKVIDIFGAGKQALLSAVEDDLNLRLASLGLHFEMVSFVGALRCDSNVMQSINATIEATQLAISAQNKVVQSRAEADQAIETARGQAESILAVAKAQAEANKLVALSLTPELVRWRAIERWDGLLPRVAGSDSAMTFMLPVESR